MNLIKTRILPEGSTNSIMEEKMTGGQLGYDDQRAMGVDRAAKSEH